MLACDDILIKNLDWTKQTSKVMNRLSLDYSSPSHWNKEMLALSNVDIPSVWNIGRAAAEQMLNRNQNLQGDNCDYSKFLDSAVTFLKPFGGKKICLSEIEIDVSSAEDDEPQELIEMVSEVEDEVNIHDLADVIPQTSQAGVQHDTQIMIEGSYVYKATVIKNEFSDSPLSKDRLRRVQGLTKFTKYGESSDAIQCLVITFWLLSKI